MDCISAVYLYTVIYQGRFPSMYSYISFMYLEYLGMTLVHYSTFPPRYASITLGSWRISSAGPERTILPVSSTYA